MENLAIWLGVLICSGLILFIGAIVYMVAGPIIQTNDIFQEFKSDSVDNLK